MSRSVRTSIILVCFSLLVISGVLVFAILPLLCTPTGNNPALLPRIVLPLADRVIAIGDMLLLIGVVIGIASSVED